jgi:EAL domain-containing protein (putative c-di-GMP-specific phosphodiesterase class I)
LNEWRQSLPDLTIAVNITPTVIGDLEIVDLLASATRIWNLDADAVVLEVTENALMIDPEASRRILAAIRDFGAGVSIDDFGTGYSSLAYLRDIPADELKIDRSFVTNMRSDPGDRKIVEHAISIAKSFDLRVVAEGVPDGETMNDLRALGCDYAQGHHICEPLPAAEFLAWCLEWNRRPR